ncbi:MAG: TPM domain-containing protein [Prevotella sp.]|nr:TPM domain-containing protein [Prevotella sp.]MCI2102828.1 TPM domain-containing protein [Prevotella sp.]
MALTDFLSSTEQHRIVDAIAQAERHTSGEIVVHITPKCSGDPLKRAVNVFQKLRLYHTERRNAVLIFIAYQSRKFAIIGDLGINQLVPINFWDQAKDLLGSAFASGRHADGLCEAISLIGNSLSRYFPADPSDRNELSNEISYEDA